MRSSAVFTKRAGVASVLFAIGAACLLSGCANFSEVISANDEDDYSLIATGVSYTMSMPALTVASRAKAASYCAATDRQMQLRQQVRGWRPMQVEIGFRCLARAATAQKQSASLAAVR